MTILLGILNPSAALFALLSVLLLGNADATSWSRSIIVHSKLYHGPWGVGGAQVSSSPLFSRRPQSFVVRGGSMESMAEEEDEAPVDNGGEGGDDDDDEEEEAVAQEEKAEDEPVAEKATEEASEVPDEDEDSSANIDSMDYADAYDEEVEGGDEEEEEGERASPTGDADTTMAESSASSTSFADATGVQSSGQTPQKIPLVTEITPAMKDILVKQLKYRPKEVESMRPEIAAVVVAKELQRPQEGLPPHWLVANATAQKKSGFLGGRAKSILLSVLAIAAAIVGGTALSNGGYEFVWDAAASSSSTATAPPTATTKYEPPAPPEPEPGVPAADEPDDEPQEELFAATETVEHEHSLRPGQRPPTEPVDETLLDKFLTKVEKGLSRMFGR